MRHLILLVLVLIAGLQVGCATAKPKGYELPPALREVYRGGELKGLENRQPDLNVPANYDLVQHTCTSAPIFNLDGSYSHTTTKCW